MALIFPMARPQGNVNDLELVLFNIGSLYYAAVGELFSRCLRLDHLDPDLKCLREKERNKDRNFHV